MRYQRIAVTEMRGEKQSRLGGTPFMEHESQWPKNPETGTPLLLLLSIESNFLDVFYPDVLIPQDWCISVFVCFESASRNCIRSLAIQEESQLGKIGNGASRVILHKRSLTPCSPLSDAPPTMTVMGLTLGPLDDEEVDPNMPDRGTIFSKLGGVPGWAQDPINVPGHKYILQLSERDFWENSRTHAGVLGGDTGFLFLRQPLVLGEIGTFFIQFG